MWTGEVVSSRLCDQKEPGPSAALFVMKLTRFCNYDGGRRNIIVPPQKTMGRRDVGTEWPTRRS